MRGDFGDSRQEPAGRQAWCILFTEQLALQQSNKKYFWSGVINDKNPTHLSYTCTLTIASRIRAV